MPGTWQKSSSRLIGAPCPSPTPYEQSITLKLTLFSSGPYNLGLGGVLADAEKNLSTTQATARKGPRFQVSNEHQGGPAGSEAPYLQRAARSHGLGDLCRLGPAVDATRQASDPR